MHTLVLSDLHTDVLHHAYACSAHDREQTAHAIQEWWNAQQKAQSRVLSYQTFGIDDAHDLGRVSQYSTGQLDECIIITATSLTDQAQNRLLKLFEEPVAGLHFFLVIPSFDILLPTLASRIQNISISEDADTTFNPKTFLADSPSKRLATIEKLLKKADEGEEAKSTITRSIADGLEQLLADNPKLRNPKTLEAISMVRNYASLQGASHKILLEYLSLAF